MKNKIHYLIGAFSGGISSAVFLLVPHPESMLLGFVLGLLVVAVMLLAQWGDT